ncbi:MAG TPA: flavin reductase family protein [Stellaceae bacterium]|nr:flavin reductase family protein [Stellaceae bacterium]
MSFTDREFRNALGRFATGVTLVTAEVEGQLLGATVSSFNSVSLSPPLILFSLSRTAKGFPLWRQATHFGVTVLGHDQHDLSDRFARGGVDKWAGIVPKRGIAGVPLIEGGIACFECVTHAFHDGGDHEIVIGRVLDFSVGDADPLLFHGGRYRHLRELETTLLGGG